jgi:iron(III) transport system ATP-binding protein
MSPLEPYIQLRRLSKTYGVTPAVRELDLDVPESHFVSLLGPSGCGKTTTLRMIAGLIEPTDGEIIIGGHVLSSKNVFIPPEDRKLGMVFQSYAVWPHMNVFNNVAYPLRIKKHSSSQIKEKVDRILGLTRLEEYASRMPHELSGGQQQRVALARALVMEPIVLLLDEPLSNLDAKLREEMRYEIKDLQKRLNMTIIYVTHDQSEAMAMSDTIVIMKDGVVQQVGTPKQIYFQPANHFVAGFIGQASFLPGRVVKLEDNRMVVAVPELGTVECCGALPEDTEVIVAVRPEDICLSDALGAATAIHNVTFLGDKIDYRLKIGGQLIRSTQPLSVEFNEGDRVQVDINRACIFTK